MVLQFALDEIDRLEALSPAKGEVAEPRVQIIQRGRTGIEFLPLKQGRVKATHGEGDFERAVSERSEKLDVEGSASAVVLPQHQNRPGRAFQVKDVDRLVGTEQHRDLPTEIDIGIGTLSGGFKNGGINSVRIGVGGANNAGNQQAKRWKNQFASTENGRSGHGWR